MMPNIQPVLENDELLLRPLQEDDFAALYALASDPKVWEQHPNKERWKKEVFQGFFNGAMQSKGAFAIIHRSTGEIIGSTRFYDYDEAGKSIFIGYTFYGTAYWGRGINPAVKAMMLEYIFRYVNQVYFHIGAGNVRSQIAIGRIGARKIAEEDVAYVGEQPRPNFVYLITREEWNAR